MRCQTLSIVIRVCALVCCAWAILAPALAETPRETPLSTADELATFELADDQLTIELVASEPELNSPVAISWDADGRMYVAEMIDYPLGPTAGKISLLEDRDGDGRYEHATVFAKGLNFPNGVLAAQGGVFITAAPDLLFMRDNDGDGVADETRIVFTGFAEGNQQLRANGLTWGLDGWIYGANGRSDGAVRAPNDPPEKAVSIRARDFRFRPDGSRFEATSGQSQFGQASDDWGNRFLGWNTIPIRHAVFDQAQMDRSPLLAPQGVRDIADPADNGEVFPRSPRPQTFNRERTDYYNAMCGLTIFRGDQLGPQYQGNAFVGESLTSLVHRRVLEPAGVTFVSRRGESGREFLASRDNWFHPVYMTTGPDGALYVVDFYRRWVEHPAFVAESLRKGVEWQHGTGHGRIWRIRRRDAQRKHSPLPGKMSSAELVEQLRSPNGWRRDTAQRLLIERHEPNSVDSLRALCADKSPPTAKIHALWTLENLLSLKDKDLAHALADTDEHVLVQALRLASPRVAVSAELRRAVDALAAKSSPLVDFHLANTLAMLSGSEQLNALRTIAGRDAEDPLVPWAIVAALDGSAADFLRPLMTEDAWRQQPSAGRLRFLKLVAARSVADERLGPWTACLDLITAKHPGPGDLALLAGLGQGLSEQGKLLPSALAENNAASDSRTAALKSAVAAARELAAQNNSSIDQRVIAIEALAHCDPAAGELLASLVEPEMPQEIQSAAAAAAAQTDTATAEAMFEKWGALTTTTRRALVSAALRSAATRAALVAALEEQHVLVRELEPGVREALVAVRDPELAARFKKLLDAAAATGNRQQVIDQYAPVLATAGDAQRGAKVFEKQCLTCHAVQGRGQKVGPDLSSIGSRPKETLLVDILDPSRQVSANFVAYTLVTKRGQILSGLIAAEAAGSITLVRSEGATEVVERSQLEELRSSGKSLMPEGLEQVVSPADMADLLAFLATPEAKLFSSPR